MAKTLNMRFALLNGKTTTMSLAAPRDDLAREDVEPAMQSIVDKQAIVVSDSPVAAIKDAVIREVNETQLI